MDKTRIKVQAFLSKVPLFANLRGDPRFEAARTRILNHIARERAELGPLTI